MKDRDREFMFVRERWRVYVCERGIESLCL